MRMFIKPVDFRKSFNGLALIVEQQLDVPLMSGALFIFTNRNRKRMKILYWDSTGLALWSKRLEQHMFKWPVSTDTAMHLNEQQLSSLLGGFSLDGHEPLFYASAGL